MHLAQGTAHNKHSVFFGIIRALFFSVEKLLVCKEMNKHRNPRAARLGL